MLKSFRVGVPGVSIFKPNGTVIDSASSVGYTAVAKTPDTPATYNSVKKPLVAGVQYQVIWAFVGQDLVNNGYTVTQSSSAAAAVTPTAGQGIAINIPAANLPNTASNTPAIAVFLKAGNGNYSLADFAYLDVSSGLDFNHTLVTRPLQSAPGPFTASQLTSGASTSILGSRRAGGWTKSTLAPTTGGVTVDRQVSTVTLSPDNSADFDVATTRTAQISFALLSNDILDVVQGNAGSYVAYTVNGVQFQEGQMSINTAAALITGCNPITLLMPPDGLGYQEVRLYLGQLLQNQSANTENWTKNNQTPINYVYSAVANDTLTDSMDTEIQFKVLV